MASEQIKVEIDAVYDDKGAKQARKDLTEIDAAEATAEINVDDNASGDIDQVDTKLDAVDGRSAEATVDVDDNATAAVDGVDTKLDGVDGRSVEATLDVDDNASRDIDAVDTKLDGVDGRTAEATVDATVGPGLTNAEGELDAIDRRTARATVDATVGPGLTNAEGELDAIDGRTARATVDADLTPGASGLLDRIGGLGARVGEVGPKLTNLAAAGGPIAAVAGAFVAAATKAATVATEADRLAELTGTSVENASSLQAVLRDTTDIEANDLNELMAQVTGALASNPSLMTNLGISMDTVRQGPFKTFIAAVDAWNSGQLSANEKILIGSQIFGEEGLTQINTLVSALDTDLATAVDNVAEGRIIHDDDVQAARDLKQGMTELSVELETVVLQLGTDLLPLLGEAAQAVGILAQVLPDPDDGTFFGGINQDLSAFPELAEEYMTDAERAEQRQREWNAALDNAADLFGTTREEIAATGDAVVAAEPDYVRGQQTLEDYNAAVDAAAEALTEQAAAQRDAAAASEEQTEAILAANDVFYAHEKAVRDARDAVARYDEVADDNIETSDDEADALQDVAEAAQDVADTAVDTARQTRTAAGASLSHTEALDIQNQSLLEQAGTLQGPTRQALIDHIARLNGIPPEVVSEILALIDEGKIDEAEALLNSTSRTRTSTVQADADNASVAQTEQQLNNLARTRQAQIVATVFANVANSAIGRILAAAGFPGLGTQSAMAPAPPTVQPLAAAGGDVYNLNLPRGTRIGDTVRELDRHARRNGRRPYAFRR
jgi:hypothetical protein